MGKQYTVSDGKMMLILEEATEGVFVVTSPLDPAIVTQAETLQDAFLMAYDAAKALAVGRKRLGERLGLSRISPSSPRGDMDDPQAVVMESRPGAESLRSRRRRTQA